MLVAVRVRVVERSSMLSVSVDSLVLWFTIGLGAMAERDLRLAVFEREDDVRRAVVGDLHRYQDVTGLPLCDSSTSSACRKAVLAEAARDHLHARVARVRRLVPR